MMLSALAVLALAPQGPTGLFIERGIVVTDSSAPRQFLRVPEGPGPVTAVLLEDTEQEYKWSRVFGGLNVDVSAFSGGASRVVCNTLGRADLETAPADWGFLMFAVEIVDAGSGSGTIDAADQFKDQYFGNGLTNDTWSFWLPGSEIPAGYVDELELARDGGDMYGVNDITGMDHNLFSLSLADTVASAARDELGQLFFTVDPDSILTVADWFNRPSAAGTAAVDPSSATILVTYRNGGEWTAPEVHLSWADLGLDVDDHITALAVDRFHHRVLCGVDDADKQLWVAIYDTDWLPNPNYYLGPYLDEDGDDFMDTVGFGADVRFRGLCAGDPGVNGNGFGQETFVNRTFGLPANSQAPRPCFDIAISRTYDRATQTDQMTAYLKDLDCVLPSEGIAVLSFEGIEVDSYPISAALQIIAPLPEVNSCTISVPNILIGMDVWWSCTVLGPGGTIIASSHRLGITI